MNESLQTTKKRLTYPPSSAEFRQAVILHYNYIFDKNIEGYEALPEMWRKTYEISFKYRDIIAMPVLMLREKGYSWTKIAIKLNISTGVARRTMAGKY